MASNLTKALEFTKRRKRQKKPKPTPPTPPAVPDKLADRTFMAQSLARFFCEATGGFADVEDLGNGDPEHLPTGGCWITLRVYVKKADIDEWLTKERSAPVAAGNTP